MKVKKADILNLILKIEFITDNDNMRVMLKNLNNCSVLLKNPHSGAGLDISLDYRGDLKVELFLAKDDNYQTKTLAYYHLTPKQAIFMRDWMKATYWSI